MASIADIKKLKTSWTKYDAVKVIAILGDNNLEDYLTKKEKIDIPVLKSFLGIDNLTDTLPFYWKEIYKHPRQLRLFGLVAAIFTHYDIIKKFASKYSTGKMAGELIVEDGKYGTNLRSALVESGASSKEYRKQPKVPYDLSPLYENGDVGLLFKHLLTERLKRVGFDLQSNPNQFYKICNDFEFYKALSLSKDLFKLWTNGSSISDTQKNNEYSFKQLSVFKEIPALKVNQWLNDWDDIDFKAPHRRKPEPYFLMFKVDARLLKRLSDVHRRKADAGKAREFDVQRNKSETRTEEIKKYIEGGFPWSTIRWEEQGRPENHHLKMPGILPTAIIANIIGPSEKRGMNVINNNDLVTLKAVGDNVKIVIPDSAFEDNWDPNVKPIEIIDGQHRLWAFDENDPVSGNYELPVIAYYNLDRTWQAYLFYTINIKPVKINTSLGYDLYPLLRTQAWLENSKDGLLAYRETRAQEIVEALWRYDMSPWKDKINMLGESGGPAMSQAAFIRSLTNTYFRNTQNRGSGGLFGTELTNKSNEVINWNRSQQAAFIILLWIEIASAFETCNEEWAIALKKTNSGSLTLTDKSSMLGRDQGVRGTSMFSNDFFYQVANSDKWNFNIFEWDQLDDHRSEGEKIAIACNQFQNDPNFANLIKSFSRNLMRFDWRSSSAEFNTENERNNQLRFKGSSGYTEIWKDLVDLFSKSDDQTISEFALLLNS